MWRDYVNELANKAGFSQSTDYDDNFNHLLNWGVVEKSDYIKFDEPIDYASLIRTLASFAQCDEKQLGEIVSLTELKTLKHENISNQIDILVTYINNQPISSNYEYIYTDKVKENKDDLNNGDVYFDEKDNTYYTYEDGIYKDADYKDVYDAFTFSDSYELNLEEAEIIPSENEELSYTNNNFNLIATKTHAFNTKGYRVSYTINSSTISVHLSRKIEGINFYGDLAISNIKPSYKWSYEKGDLKNAYFKVSFNSTEKVGCSIGKYGNYIADFSKLDGEDFLTKLKSILKKDDNLLEATIPICTIKTPIKNIPSAYFNLDLVAKVYVNGKIELQFYNSHCLGFETKNGELRLIDEATKDYDAIVSGSGKACLGLNFNLEAIKQRLMDLEFDGGIRAQIKSTLHIYDEDGKMRNEESDLTYSVIEELSELNDNVLVCGDVSLHWVFDINFNTYKTLLYKLGFSKVVHILDEDNQVFGNLHHIENGQFVEKCTRRNRTYISGANSIKTYKIVLNSYAEVIDLGNDYQINVLRLPDGYSENDLLYEIEDESIASVNKGLVHSIALGTTRVIVSTSDKKYKSYVNILVSDN